MGTEDSPNCPTLAGVVVRAFYTLLESSRFYEAIHRRKVSTRSMGRISKRSRADPKAIFGPVASRLEPSAATPDDSSTPDDDRRRPCQGTPSYGLCYGAAPSRHHRIADGRITSQTLLMHSGQHRNIDVDVVEDRYGSLPLV